MRDARLGARRKVSESARCRALDPARFEELRVALATFFQKDASGLHAGLSGAESLFSLREGFLGPVFPAPVHEEDAERDDDPGDGGGDGVLLVGGELHAEPRMATWSKISAANFL